MPGKILIVDDTSTIRMYLKMILSLSGYSLEEASNGVEALDRITASPPDVVLLDVAMPEMDGLECCRRIKASPDSKEVVVIMVTSQGKRSQIDDAYAAGCDDYVTKPIRKVELLAKLRRHDRADTSS